MIKVNNMLDLTDKNILNFAWNDIYLLSKLLLHSKKPEV